MCLHSPVKVTHSWPCWDLPNDATSFIGRDARVEEDTVDRVCNAIGFDRSEGTIDRGTLDLTVGH